MDEPPPAEVNLDMKCKNKKSTAMLAALWGCNLSLMLISECHYAHNDNANTVIFITSFLYISPF